MKKRTPPSKLPLELLPERLTALGADCSKCGTFVKPDLFAVSLEPVVPVKPNNTPEGDLTRWRPYAMEVDCAKCGTPVAVPYPNVTKRGEITFYGDDASRHEDEVLSNYTMVGAQTAANQTVSEGLHALKVSLAPNAPPESWTFHMKELTSSQKRKRHPIFASWDNATVSRAIDGLFDLVKSEHLHKYSITLGHRAGAERWAKETIYTLLVMVIVDAMTHQGIQPTFVFDSELPIKDKTAIHKWASDSFLGSQFSRLYACITHGIEVSEPIFVKPASHPLLELADFCAYVIARSFWQFFRGKQPDLDSRRLGPVLYLDFERGGNLRIQSTVGIQFHEYRRR